MSVERITKRVVDAAKASRGTYLVRDSQLKGFVLVVTPYGGKSYAIDYRAVSLDTRHGEARSDKVVGLDSRRYRSFGQSQQRERRADHCGIM
jgi:hypothetical protein